MYSGCSKPERSRIPSQVQPVHTPALRIEVQLQPDWSGGVLERRVD